MRRSAGLGCAAALLIPFGWAQQTLAPMERGIQPNSVYSVSELESVNLKSGNLNLQVPLTALPPGPGGSSAQVGLSYNSQIYDVTVGTDNSTGAEAYRLTRSTTGGGWRYNYGQYALYEENRALDPVTGRPDCSEPNGHHQFRHYLVFPDGSRHMLRMDVLSNVLSGTSFSVYTGASYDDYNLYNVKGDIDVPGFSQGCSVGPPMASRPTLYTDDGTYVRVTTQSALNFTATMQVDWGAQATPGPVRFSATGVPNGWAVAFNPMESPYTSGTAQTAGLTITPPPNAAAGNYRVEISGISGSVQASTGVTVSVPGGAFTPDAPGAVPAAGFGLSLNGGGAQAVAWTAYFPDGRKVDGIGTQTNRITDRNGNAVTVTGYFDPSDLRGPEVVVADQANRRVRISHSLGADGADKVMREYCASGTLCAPADPGWQATQTHQVLWQWYSGATKLHLCGLSQGVSCHLTPGGTYVKRITLPAAVSGEQALTYEFGYNTEGTTNGWGELRTITTPGGYSATYSYALDGMTTADEALLWNPVTTKVGTIAGAQPETWTYSLSLSPTMDTVTGPDGGNSYTFFTNVGTMAWKVQQPNGNYVERLWYQNRPPNWNPQASYKPNPYIKTEYRSIQTSTGPKLASIKDYTYDKNNNLKAVDEYDCLAAACGAIPREDGVPTGLPTGLSAARHSEYSYYTSTANADAGGSEPNAAQADAYWSPAAPRMLSARKTAKVTGTGDPRYSEYTYDDGRGAGNLTEQLDYDSTKAASLPNSLTKDTNAIRSFKGEYDANGNLLRSYDAKGTATRYDYGAGSCMNSYPTAVVGSENVPEETLTSGMGWYCESGLLQTSTDPNSTSRTMVYDVLGRIRSVTEANGENTRTTSTTYSDVNRTAATVAQLDASRTLTTTETYDARGRLIGTTAPSVSGSCTAATVERKYLTPTSGNASYYGFSYELASNPYCTTADATMGWTRTKRDANGRVVEVAYFSGSAAPGPWGSSTATTGAASTNYDGQWTTLQDPAGKKRKTRVDGLGRMVEVVEDPDSSAYSTAYEYDLRDSLKSVTQTRKAAGVADTTQTRTFVYDSLGRLKSAGNAESGTTSYTYDDNGNVHTVQLAGGTTRTYGYNSRNQITTKSYTLANTPAVYYCYDGKTATTAGCTAGSAANSQGRLTGVGSSTALVKYTGYDWLGRVVNSEQWVDGQRYPFVYDYLAGGQLKYVKHPSGRELSYAYNNAGQPLSVARGSTPGDCAGGNCYASGFAYWPHGAVSSGTFGAVSQAFTYNSRLQLTDISVTKDAATKWALTNTYSATQNNGDIGSQTVDARGAGGIQVATAYGYDGLDRLKSSTESVSGTIVQSYDYDSVGNRWVKSAESNYVPSTLTPLGASGYEGGTNHIVGTTYDPAQTGNVTGMGGYTLEYDAESRLKKVTLNGVTQEYWYDGDGRRVKKQTGSGQATVFVYDAGGRLAAEYGLSGGGIGTQYLVQDHLGSTRMVVDGTGAVQGLHDYLPFGEEIPPGVGGRNWLYGGTDGVRQKFTGKERDGELASSEMEGLDYFGARYFSGAQGRFTTTDLAAPDWSNPQSLNKYAYALNNPLRYVDRNGLYAEDVHRDLTTVLALAAGIDARTAERIGRADQGVDENPATRPSTPEQYADYHYPSGGRLETLWSGFQESGSAADLGVYLHVKQDSYAHAGYPPPLGHIFAGTAPDQTWRRPLVGEQMAMAVYLNLGIAKSRLSGEQYRALPWEQILPGVQAFMNARTPDEKRRALEALRAQAQQNIEKQKRQPKRKKSENIGDLREEEK